MRPRFRPNTGFAHNLAMASILHASIDFKKKNLTSCSPRDQGYYAGMHPTVDAHPGGANGIRLEVLVQISAKLPCDALYLFICLFVLPR